MHNLLSRQLKRHFGATDSVPKEWETFLQAVDEAYGQFDADRKMLESSLDLSSQELLRANFDMRAVFQAFPDLLFRLDENGTILDCKGGTAVDLYLPLEKLLGKRVQDVPLAGVNTKFLDAIRLMREKKSPVGIEYSIQHQGQERFYEARFVPLLESQIIVNVRNITERKCAEEALRVSGERLRSVTETAQEGIIIANSDGQIVLWNKGAQDIFGYALDEALGQPLTLLIPERYKEQHRQGFEHFLTTGESHIMGKTVELHGRRRDGAEFPLELNLASWADGKEIFFSGILRDITERKKAEEGLKNTLSLLSATLESTADGILVVDREGKIVSFNRKFVGMWNIPESVILSQDDNQALEFVLNQLKEPARFLAKVRELYASPEVESYDLLEFKDGRVFERYSQPQKIDGKSVGRVWSFRDISERQHLQGQLQQAQKMEAIGQLAGGVAHDFNNLLTIIIGYCDFLLDQMGNDPAQRKEVEAIRKTAQRAANLTRQLLAFSRRQILQPKVVDLNEIVLNMDKMLRRLIGEDIDLLTVRGKELWPIEADPGQLEQVIMNLAVNARDAMPSGGELTIETCNLTIDESVETKPGKVPPGKYATMTVADTGVGMTTEVQERIFEPFFTTKEVGKGTGLGLSTVYGIVKQSGGHIVVHSKLGRGTAFSLYFPMSENALEKFGTGKIHFEKFQGKETILLVEDEEEVRAVIDKILKKQGYTVMGAANGVEALSLLEEHSGPVHLLLTDLVMPKMGGPELVERLTAHRPEIKILFMSGYTNSESVRQRILSSDSAFLQKPFTPTDLARTVREVLDAGRNAKANS